MLIEEINHVLRRVRLKNKSESVNFRLCCETNLHNSFENGIPEQLERGQ